MLLPVFILKPVLLFYSNPSILLWKNLASFLKEKVCCPKANTKKKTCQPLFNLGIGSGKQSKDFLKKRQIT